MDEIEIIPAIMPESFADVRDGVEDVLSCAPWVQIDVMDGHFTKRATWPLDGEDERQFENLIQEKEGLPHWEDINYEFDLMVSNPLEVARSCVRMGAERVIFHYASSPNIEDEIKKFVDEYKNDETGLPIEIGLAITIKDDFEKASALFPYVDVVQVMGIYPVGVQGAEFRDDVCDIIERVREIYDGPIAVDGGVNDERAYALVSAGATRLVSGSFVYKHEDGACMAMDILKDSSHD